MLIELLKSMLAIKDMEIDFMLDTVRKHKVINCNCEFLRIRTNNYTFYKTNYIDDAPDDV